jgi:hypothetical protein
MKEKRLNQIQDQWHTFLFSIWDECVAKHGRDGRVVACEGYTDEAKWRKHYRGMVR